MADRKSWPARICVVTSYSAAQEPRAPKHAMAALAAFPDAEVVFLDMAAGGRDSASRPGGLPPRARLKQMTLDVPTRQHAPLRWALRKLLTVASGWFFSVSGRPTAAVLGPRAVGLTRILERIRADVYVAHNIDTLLPAYHAARSNEAHLVFDCMEFYSDMGDSQSQIECRATRKIEAEVLPKCDLVLSTSDSLSEALAATYGIEPPLALFNAPPIASYLPGKSASDALRLYWRNSVIGFGQRGLDDALVAMTMLPDDIVLTLQGRLPLDGGQALRARIDELDLSERVVVRSPYPPGQAVAEAAQHDIGLCLERRGPANHEYTTSNKLFDYMMAGLAVVVPDLDGLSRTVGRAGAGLVFEAGSPQSLAEQIGRLHRDRGELARLSRAARAFALEEGNAEHQMRKFSSVFVARVSGDPVSVRTQGTSS